MPAIGRSDSAPWQAALRTRLAQGLQRIHVAEESELDDVERWFAAHCCIRTTDQKITPLRLRRAQKEFHRDFTGRDIVDKARKLGISTYVAARWYWHVTTRPNVAAAVVAHKPDSVQELWKIVQLLYDRDPRRLPTKYSSRKELFFRDLNSYFVVLQGGKGSGRAGTFNYLHISELAHFNADALETVGGMVAAVPAPETGSEIVIESTANGEGNEFHRRWLSAVSGTSEYTAHFFPWYHHPEYARRWLEGDQEPISEEELQLQRELGLSLDQLAFRRAMREDIGAQLWCQEYPRDWQESFLASGRKVFDGQVLLALEKRHAQPPIQEQRWGSSYLRIYAPPRSGRRYCAGADTSEGVLGGDAQDVRVLDFETMAEVAVLHGHWPIHVFARKLTELCKAYSAFTAVERNNHGHAVLEHLLRGDDLTRMPPELVYRHRSYDQTGKAVLKPGWPTDRKTKPVAIADLEEAIRRSHLLARDPLFYAEARAFAHLDDGSMGAPPGMNDDSVMAMALALQARKHTGVSVGYQTEPILLGL